MRKVSNLVNEEFVESEMANWDSKMGLTPLGASFLTETV